VIGELNEVSVKPTTVDLRPIKARNAFLSEDGGEEVTNQTANAMRSKNLPNERIDKLMQSFFRLIVSLKETQWECVHVSRDIHQEHHHNSSRI